MNEEKKIYDLEKQLQYNFDCDFVYECKEYYLYYTQNVRGR